MFRVVIVEDADIIIEELKEAVPWEKYGCRIIGVAYNGVEGRELILREKPDILFTDIQMPQMNGLVMLAGLRSEMPELQIAVLTSYRDFDYAQTAISLGVARFLTKPAQIHEIEEALEFMCAHVADKDASVQKVEPEAPTDERAGSFLVRNALKYIEEHYCEKLTLAQVAEKTYVSQWHLSKLLSKYTGQGFSDILNNMRVERAKKEMRDPSLRIYEISRIVGFSDVAHFSKIFKKITGISPNAYRNTIG